MFVSFDSLPRGSRVWIFQSNRGLTDQEVQVADTRLRAFTEEWVVHGSPLAASYSIRYNQFIILAADESDQTASGCSIDSSVRALRELENLMSIDLFDRNQVAFLVEGKVTLFPLKNLKEKFATGILSGETLTFNNLAGTIDELQNKWLLPAVETWVKRYIPNTLANVK